MSDSVGKKVSWLDSCRMPARIHRILDGSTTVCGYDFVSGMHDWILSRVPKRIRGQSRYCKICFNNTSHNIQWDDKCPGQ